MKKTMILVVVSAFLLSSCGSYTAQGAYTGSSLGSILGSAIGGITNGPRGSDWGQIIGMAGGAVVGGAIGNAADKAQQRKVEEYHDRVAQRTGSQQYGDSGFDPQNSGDDRIEFAPGNVNRPAAGALTISNVRFIDEDGDRALRFREQGRIEFEIRNRSNRTVYNVQPVVQEMSGNNGILVSPTISVESIAAGSGIRYTARVYANKKLRNGSADFQIYVLEGKMGASSNVKELRVETRR